MLSTGSTTAFSKTSSLDDFTFKIVLIYLLFCMFTGLPPSSVWITSIELLPGISLEPVFLLVLTELRICYSTTPYASKSMELKFYMVCLIDSL